MHNRSFIYISKTTIIHFNQRTTTDNAIEVNNGAVLKKFENEKSFGVIIDANLNWKARIRLVSKKLSSFVYGLVKLPRNLTQTDADYAV